MIGLGGRKFIFALICLIVGTAIELKTDRGVSAQFVGLLLGLAAMFNVSNVMATKNYNDSKVAGETSQDSEKMSGQVADLQDSIHKVGQAVVGISTLLSNVANNGVKK